LPPASTQFQANMQTPASLLSALLTQDSGWIWRPARARWMLLPLRKPVSGTASHIDIRLEFCLLGWGPGLARGRASSRRETVTFGLAILRQPILDTNLFLIEESPITFTFSTCLVSLCGGGGQQVGTARVEAAAAHWRLLFDHGGGGGGVRSGGCWRCWLGE